MAIQNDNTLVTKGDLKALYSDKIAPYLGANLALATNNSDYYTTEEKIIGVWTNGKPLYQKTVEQILNSGDSVEYHIPTGVSDLDAMIDIQGLYLNPNGNVSLLPAVYVVSAGGNIGGAVQISFVKANNWIMVRPGTGGWFPSGNSYGVRITFRYTKTSDTASSAATTPGCYDINFPNTWPENTEIYFGNGFYGYRATGNVNVKSSQINSAIFPITSTAKPISFGGNFKRGTEYYPLPYSDTALTYSLFFYSANSTCELVMKDNHNASLPYDVWVTYIK